MTSRELLEILRGLASCNLVSADVVEVAPAYDHAEITSVAASHTAYDLTTIMSRQIAEARFEVTHDHDLELRPTAAQTEAALNPPPGRNGGDLVVETLAGLGATTVFGLPGQHALGMFDALRRSDLRYIGLRVENNAGFAADAYGRITGEAAPLLLSTGPGALTSLAALQEARAASAPVLAISSQIPTAGLGGGRHGYLHELPDQSASFRGVVKSVHTVRTQSQIPSAIAEAWKSALTAPHGPVWVEIPQDVLLAATLLPVVTAVDATPEELIPRPELTAVAADLLSRAARPAIIAGGGVVRCGRVEEAAAVGGEASGAGGDDAGRQGRVPLDAPAVPPVLAGGPSHDGLPGGRGRSAGGGLGPGRTVLELPHVRAARPGHPDRGGPRQTGVEPPGAGHPRGRVARASGAAGDGDGAGGRDGGGAGGGGARPGRGSASTRRN